jgi:hypothetical protein
VAMVMERWNGTGAWSFPDTSALQSILSHCTVHLLGESDTWHLKI